MDVLAAGALEAAGVEPVTVATATWKSGPYEGPTLMRIGRKTTLREARRALTEGTRATPSPLSTRLSTVCTCVASCATRGERPACWKASITIACSPATRVEE